MSCVPRTDCQPQCCDKAFNCPIDRNACYYFPGIDYDQPAWLPIATALVTFAVILTAILVAYKVKQCRQSRQEDREVESPLVTRERAISRQAFNEFTPRPLKIRVSVFR